MSDLFGYHPITGRNLLPVDGHAAYFSRVFAPDEAARLAGYLFRNIAWRSDQVVIFGKVITTRRQVAWYADHPYDYTYSGITRTALPWVEPLLEIRQKIAFLCQDSFNSCLLNLYPSGADGMGWHSDGEKDLKHNGVIASVSFGAERRFQFRHRDTKEVVSLWLEHGSLLVMKGVTQSYWLHSLPKMARVKGPRINLTFRQIDR